MAEIQDHFSWGVAENFGPSSILANFYLATAESFHKNAWKVHMKMQLHRMVHCKKMYFLFQFFNTTNSAKAKFHSDMLQLESKYSYERVYENLKFFWRNLAKLFWNYKQEDYIHWNFENFQWILQRVSV